MAVGEYPPYTSRIENSGAFLEKVVTEAFKLESIDVDPVVNHPDFFIGNGVISMHILTDHLRNGDVNRFRTTVILPTLQRMKLPISGNQGIEDSAKPSDGTRNKFEVLFEAPSSRAVVGHDYVRKPAVSHVMDDVVLAVGEHTFHLPPEVDSSPSP